MSENKTTKRCSSCGIEKTRESFPKDRTRKDGLDYKCKPCCYCQKYAYQESDKGRAVHKIARSKYRKTLNGKIKEFIYKNKESTKIKMRGYAKKWYSKINSKRIVSEYMKRRRRLSSEIPKNKARDKVKYLVRIGNLPHPSTLKCNSCDSFSKHYHHHKGYSKECWLDVIPLCIPCHIKIHKKPISWPR